jgi:hypothetical protein
MSMAAGLWYEVNDLPHQTIQRRSCPLLALPNIYTGPDIIIFYYVIPFYKISRHIFTTRGPGWSGGEDR